MTTTSPLFRTFVDLTEWVDGRYMVASLRRSTWGGWYCRGVTW